MSNLSSKSSDRGLQVSTPSAGAHSCPAHSRPVIAQRPLSVPAHWSKPTAQAGSALSGPGAIDFTLQALMMGLGSMTLTVVGGLLMMGAAKSPPTASPAATPASIHQLQTLPQATEALVPHQSALTPQTLTPQTPPQTAQVEAVAALPLSRKPDYALPDPDLFVCNNAPRFTPSCQGLQTAGARTVVNPVWNSVLEPTRLAVPAVPAPGQMPFLVQSESALATAMQADAARVVPPAPVTAADLRQTRAASHAEADAADHRAAGSRASTLGLDLARGLYNGTALLVRPEAAADLDQQSAAGSLGKPEAAPASTDALEAAASATSRLGPLSRER